MNGRVLGLAGAGEQPVRRLGQIESAERGASVAEARVVNGYERVREDGSEETGGKPAGAVPRNQGITK